MRDHISPAINTGEDASGTPARKLSHLRFFLVVVPFESSLAPRAGKTRATGPCSSNLYHYPEHALVDSLPRLTPAAGSTPDAVTATGEWEEILFQAKLTWSASDDPNLSGYSIRFCPGPNYSTGDESVIGNVSSAGPNEFATTAGLDAPGSTATFKIYVTLTTGNEKGSNTVSITRPT